MYHEISFIVTTKQNKRFRILKKLHMISFIFNLDTTICIRTTPNLDTSQHIKDYLRTK